MPSPSPPTNPWAKTVPPSQASPTYNVSPAPVSSIAARLGSYVPPTRPRASPCTPLQAPLIMIITDTLSPIPRPNTSKYRRNCTVSSMDTMLLESILLRFENYPKYPTTGPCICYLFYCLSIFVVRLLRLSLFVVRDLRLALKYVVVLEMDWLAWAWAADFGSWALGLLRPVEVCFIVTVN